VVSQIFVNLPVKDLNKTKVFFPKLGFTYNQQFTDENAACLIIGENIYAMLLVEKFFNSFTKKEICDSSKSTEAILAIMVESKEEVYTITTKALEAWRSEPREPQDHGWMYGRSFQDIDGHLWEVGFMDASAMPKN
jgi:predicted lactoylglutathione lyase